MIALKPFLEAVNVAVVCLFSQSSFAATAVRATSSSNDFSISVTITKPNQSAKGGVVELKNGKCRTLNGDAAKVREKKVCDDIAKEIELKESALPKTVWINAPGVATVTLIYKRGSREWKKETGLFPDPSNNRNIVRELALRVLETAQ